MIRMRRQKIESTVLQQKYIISALYPKGPPSPQSYIRLMNKLKDMGF